MGSRLHEEVLGRARYPRQPEIERAIRIVRQNGIHVSSVELARDGTIRLSDRSAAPAASLFDALEKANKL